MYTFITVKCQWITKKNIDIIIVIVNIFCRFSDYCYLVDESTGCYDTRQNRICVVITDFVDNFEFGIQDVDMIEKEMRNLDFDVQQFHKNKDHTHDTFMKYLKTGNKIAFINFNVPLEQCLDRTYIIVTYTFISTFKCLGSCKNPFANICYSEVV